MVETDPKPARTEASDSLDELFAALRLSLGQADQILASTGATPDGQGAERLQHVLTQTELQASRLLQLHVAARQLHSELELDAVCRALGEITVDLLGASSYALLLRNWERDTFRVQLARGVKRFATVVEGDDYRGGVAIIDQALEQRSISLDGGQAAVPLCVGEHMTAMLVILDVFAHKDRSLAEDRLVLDLIASQAGSALVTAEYFTRARRRLETLRNLALLVTNDASESTAREASP